MKSLARKFYYTLPPSWRYVARWIAFLPSDTLHGLLPKSSHLVPPRRMIFTGAGHFVKIGDAFLLDFISKKIIRQDSTVLDIGSGIGRIALALTRYLRHGHYEGFDIMEQGVHWCRQNISPRFPNFIFRQVSLANDLYRQSGDAAANFVFPYPDLHFDLAIATSVFTHMLPSEVQNYIRETYRTLKPGGYAYFTFFILNEKSVTQMRKDGNEFNFRFDKGNYRLLDDKVQSANVAYDETFLFSEIISPDQFETVSIDYGTWSTILKGDAIAFQDRVVLRRK